MEYQQLNVKELHKILTELIEQGKGDYEVCAEIWNVALYSDFAVSDDRKAVCF